MTTADAPTNRNEGTGLHETWVINYPKAMSPNGSLSMALSQKNGEYLGKQITFRRNWDYEKCADEVIAGRGEIVFKWRHKFDGAVEISTPFFWKVLYRFNYFCNASR
jgi:hypothetical protein